MGTVVGVGLRRGKMPLDNRASSRSSRRSMGAAEWAKLLMASASVATELQTSVGRTVVASSDWMTRAGTPTARVAGGMLRVMTLPAPITAPSPMVTPPLFYACRSINRPRVPRSNQTFISTTSQGGNVGKELTRWSHSLQSKPHCPP